MIRGIGQSMPRSCARLGEKVFDTIEAEPERLREVTGRPVRANRSQPPGRTEDRPRNHGLPHSNGVAQAGVRIYKTYGATPYRVMTENPYRLAP